MIWLILFFHLWGQADSSGLTPEEKFELILNKISDVVDNSEKCRPKNPGILKPESCNSGNDYLEKQINQLVTQDSFFQTLVAPKSMEFHEYIKPECVAAAMKLNRSPKNVHCQPGAKSTEQGNSVCTRWETVKDKKTKKSKKIKIKEPCTVEKNYRDPCASENLIKITSASFNVAAYCMDQYYSGNMSYINDSIETTFFMMVQESALNPNAKSFSGAGGIGQLTEDAITDVNKSMHAEIMDDIVDSSMSSKSDTNKKLCGEMIKQAINPPMQSQNTCDRVSLDNKNPLRNIVYSLAYERWSLHVLTDKVFFQKRFMDLKSELTDDQAASLIVKIKTWTHNVGAGAMKESLNRLLTNKYKSKTLNANQTNQFLEDLKKDLAKMGGARGKERSEYLGKILDKKQAVTSELGIKSCLNKKIIY